MDLNEVWMSFEWDLNEILASDWPVNNFSYAIVDIHWLTIKLDVSGILVRFDWDFGAIWMGFHGYIGCDMANQSPSVNGLKESLWDGIYGRMLNNHLN